MDAIQKYTSSDSDDEGSECQRKSSRASDRTATSPGDCATFKAACWEEAKQTMSTSRGYGSFLHLQQPHLSDPPNISIYGVTKQKTADPCQRHYASSLHTEKTVEVTRHHRESQNKQYPPPCQHISDDDHRLHLRRIQNQHHHHREQFCSNSDHFSRQRQKRNSCENAHEVIPSADTNFGSNATALRPYVSKRTRRSEEEHLSKSGNIGENQQDNSRKTDIFAIDPYIASHGHQSCNSTPPRRRLCDFAEHEGPVTHVQWCIPPYSHLLLSSSMDKTVRMWDYSTQKRCVQTLRCHEGAVKGARWSRDGHQVLSCGFDRTARLTDAQSGTNFQVFDHPSYVTCLRWHPTDPQLFISGTYSSTVYCWDTRTGEIAHQYVGKLGQILAVEFINDGVEFVASCDTVSRDCADRTIMVWDTNTAALVSNQLYHEKYTCPCLKAHPHESVFMAQSNANYTALFSTKRPYKLNKYQRFEGHQIEGYSIGCDCSPDGSLVVSGSADGKMYIYNFKNGALVKTLEGFEGSACVDVAWHPTMPSVVAGCGWNGQVAVWH